ncbi:hypothetical protein ABKV19_018826 [Rosa sericea]
MAAIMKFLCIAILCSLIMGGESQHCNLNNLKITQSATGKSVQSRQEWKVTITNDCSCTQLNVKISSPGFQTVGPIASSILSKSGNDYLVNSGKPIYAYENFSFTYAWATQFTFKPSDSTVACSAEGNY